MRDITTTIEFCFSYTTDGDSAITRIYTSINFIRFGKKRWKEKKKIFNYFLSSRFVVFIRTKILTLRFFFFSMTS